MRALVFFALFFAVIGVANAQGWILNLLTWPFRSPEEAPYEVKRTFPNGVEERIYPAKKWAITESVTNGKILDDIKGKLSNHLYYYITGDNNDSVKLPVTTPVLTEVVGVAWAKTGYRMGYFIPEKYQRSPPEPVDANVRLSQRNPHVYVLKFGGYASESDFQSHLSELEKFLASQNIVVPKQVNGEPRYFYAEYDPKWKFWFRRNEVWIRVDNVSEDDD